METLRKYFAEEVATSAVKAKALVGIALLGGSSGATATSSTTGRAIAITACVVPGPE